MSAARAARKKSNRAKGRTKVKTGNLAAITLPPLIRAAMPKDMAAITAIYRPAVLAGTASFELEPPGEAEMLARYRAVIDGGYPYLVAECAGSIAGYAYANAYRSRPAYRYTVEDSVYVAPDAQGRGIGGALLASLVGRASEAGFRRMIAVIAEEAHRASIALHRRAGFTPCGTLPAVGYKFGRWLDVVLMQLPLGEGANTRPGDR
jgi:phosphinothricin acetyltransferase